MKFNMILILFLGMILLTDPTAWSDSPTEVSISAVSFHGNACNANNVSSVITPDGQTLSVLFDQFVSQMDGTRPFDQKSCTVEVSLTLPPGWSYSLMSADYRGFASLDQGSLGIEETVYSFDPIPDQPAPSPVVGRPHGFAYPFPGGPVTGFYPAPPIARMPVYVAPRSTTFASRILRGPYNDQYAFNDLVPVSSALWSDCSSGSSTLYLNTAILTRALSPMHVPQEPKAMMSLDSIDSQLSQDFHVQWRRCAP